MVGDGETFLARKGWGGFKNTNEGKKMKKLLGGLIGVSLILCIALDPAVAQTPPNTITFDNQSGEFDYTKGDPFKVSQAPGQYSAITITLHKVVQGNYHAEPVSGNEFENTELPQEVEARVQVQIEDLAVERTREKSIPQVQPVDSAHVESGQQEKQPMGAHGAKMVFIPAGSFSMGSDGEVPDEKPLHRVTLDAFYLDQNEVTIASYHIFLEESGRSDPEYWELVYLDEHGDIPVAGVTWHDASAYCKWAGKRLPTEAEWEMAARGIHGGKYPWGDEDPTSGMTNFDRTPDTKNLDFFTFVDLYNKYLAPVGSYEGDKSPYGVYDMGGNVREWVNDWFNDDYYARSPERNPRGPDTGRFKVVRGGGFLLPAWNLRSSLRGGWFPDFEGFDIGFRCAKTP